jgi:hypothetical protein
MVLNLYDDVENKVILLVTSPVNYISDNLNIIKHYTNKKDAFCIYITANRPYTHLINLLKKENINTKQILFIDTITSMGFDDVNRTENAIFTGSTKALTEISIAATSAITKSTSNNKLLLIDSISTLLTYNNLESVTRFSRFIINKMHDNEINGVIISVDKTTDRALIAQISQFCDKIIESN